MKKPLFFLALLQLGVVAHSQDSLKLLKKPKFNFFAADTSSFKKRVDFQFDNRNSFISSKPVNIRGINLGYFISEKIRLGLGGYLINSEFFEARKRKSSELSATFASPLNLHYLTPNICYTFYNSRWFELSVLTESGFGIVKFEAYDKKTKKISPRKEFFVPAQFGLGTLFKLNRWIIFQGSIGYRYIVFQSKEAVFKTAFNGFYYNYGVQVIIGTILKDLIYVHKYHKQEKILRKNSNNFY